MELHKQYGEVWYTLHPAFPEGYILNTIEQYQNYEVSRVWYSYLQFQHWGS
jgi:hypothetical protein